jgi:hypothetical protein
MFIANYEFRAKFIVLRIVEIVRTYQSTIHTYIYIYRHVGPTVGLTACLRPNPLTVTIPAAWHRRSGGDIKINRE